MHPHVARCVVGELRAARERLRPRQLSHDVHVHALTPFIRPFRWSRLALTYGMPVIPALSLFDGIVSQLRPGYRWDVGTVKHPLLPGKVSYLLGLPTR